MHQAKTLCGPLDGRCRRTIRLTEEDDQSNVALGWSNAWSTPCNATLGMLVTYDSDSFTVAT